MKNLRIFYFLFFIIVIFIGIISRKISFIPLFLGDFLYAMMMYILLRILLIYKKRAIIAFTALFICYGIEFLQLYQASWIISLRKTLFGKYVLGQGFLWSDLSAYAFGIIISFIIEQNILKNYPYETRFRIK